MFHNLETLEKILCYPIGTLTEGSFAKFNVEYTNPLNQSMKVCFKNSEGEILHTMLNSGFRMFVDDYDTKAWCDDSIEIKKEDKITYLKIGEYATKFLDVDSFHLEVSTSVIGDDVWIRNYTTDGIYIQKIINGQFYWNIATCLNESILAVAYYNNNYELVVETYDIVNCVWNSAVLSECVQSTHDVHCYIDLNFDARGGLHIFANCHATPVFYFYARDYTLQSIENRSSVFLHDANKATYPFIVRNKNELYYIVRSGVSGNSIDLSYKYNQDTEAWTKTKAVPTADGTNGKGGTAYFGKWVTMSDGYSYNSFCWRRTQDMITNKDILVIKTKDFEHFYSVDGKEMELPITNLNDGNAVVTRTDENSGIVNQWYTTMHEFNGHPIVVWMQYDNDGYSNIFFAYYEKKWIINKVSDFKWKWRFSKVAGTDMTFLNYDVEIINGFLKINVCSKFFDGCAYIYDDHCNFVEKIGYNGYSYGEDRNRAYLTKRFNGIKAIAITERGRGNHHYAAMTKGRLIIT